MHHLMTHGTTCMTASRAGDNTFIGKIASLATQTVMERSTLQKEVHHLVIFIAIVGFTTAVILFVIGLIRKMDPLTVRTPRLVVARIALCRTQHCRATNPAIFLISNTIE